jgi:hypothetical protein
MNVSKVPYNPGMALVVFLRGVNVGGHRTIRPSILAGELSHYDVVNVGAAGTFVIRKPGSRTKFRAELLRKLPFETGGACSRLCSATRAIFSALRWKIRSDLNRHARTLFGS